MGPVRGCGKKKTGWEAEVQENLDITLQSDQCRTTAQWLSSWDTWPPTACPELPAHLAECPDLCQDSRATAGPPTSPQLPVVPRRGRLPHKAQRWPFTHGGAGKCCSPRCSGEVLVYNIKTSLTRTFLWTKAFTLETPSVFFPIIMITEHVIPLLLFFFAFIWSVIKELFSLLPWPLCPSQPWPSLGNTHRHTWPLL